MQVWTQMQANFISNSINAKQIVTDKSGHSVQISEPELIIESIKELVELNRKENNKHKVFQR